MLTPSGTLILMLLPGEIIHALTPLHAVVMQFTYNMTCLCTGNRSWYLHNMALAIIEGTLGLEQAAPFACSSRALLGGLSCPGRGSCLDVLLLLGSCLGCCSLDLLLSCRRGGLRSCL